MNRKVSVITAAYSPLADYFAATVDSVVHQELPPGWELEWLVQEDGENSTLAATLAGVPGVAYSANRAHVGIAATRNLALARATGSIVHILDHDDVMLPKALLWVLPLFDEPDIHWASGQADDLLPDGTRCEYESALPFGRVPAGAVNDWAIEHDGNWPIHCAGLFMRTELVRAFGGWGGAPVDDDVIMFSALSECVDGFNVPETTWLYRLHDRQTHRSARWRERGGDGRRIALQRVEAIRAVELRVTGTPGTSEVAASVQVGPAAKDSAGGRPWWKEAP